MIFKKEFLQMQHKLNFIVHLILIISFLCQANSILNPEDLHFQKNRFYGSPRSKRSPNEIESEINESSVDNNGSKCVDNRENTQIENILTPNNSMINIDEIVNDFYFNEEIF